MACGEMFWCSGGRDSGKHGKQPGKRGVESPRVLHQILENSVMDSPGYVDSLLPAEALVLSGEGFGAMGRVRGRGKENRGTSV